MTLITSLVWVVWVNFLVQVVLVVPVGPGPGPLGPAPLWMVSVLVQVVVRVVSLGRRSGRLSRTPTSAPRIWAQGWRFKQPPSLVHRADTLGLTASAESKLSPSSSAQGCRPARAGDLAGCVAAPASAVRAPRSPEVAR